MAAPSGGGGRTAPWQRWPGRGRVIAQHHESDDDEAERQRAAGAAAAVDGRAKPPGQTPQDAPAWLARLRAWDHRVSTAAVERWGGDRVPRAAFLVLEATGHGGLWLVAAALAVAAEILRLGGVSAALLDTRAFHMTVALLADVAAVGTLKVAVRRRRPRHDRADDMRWTPRADRFSFPSGHASRAALVVGTVAAWQLSGPAGLATVALWGTALSVARVLMGRHYVLDVVGGLALGAFEVWALPWLVRLPPWALGFLTWDAVAFWLPPT